MSIHSEEFPSKLLAALATFEGGGAISSVATSPLLLHKVPSFILRVQVGAREVALTPFHLSVRLEMFDPEGPLVICHLYLHDLPVEVDVVRLQRRWKGMQVTVPNPFMCECFLNPTDQQDREMLQVLAESPFIRLAFFLDRSDLPFQGVRDYPNEDGWRRAAQEILDRTHMGGEPETPDKQVHFHTAVERYMREIPLF